MKKGLEKIFREFVEKMEARLDPTPLDLDEDFLDTLDLDEMLDSMELAFNDLRTSMYDESIGHGEAIPNIEQACVDLASFCMLITKIFSNEQ